MHFCRSVSTQSCCLSTEFCEGCLIVVPKMRKIPISKSSETQSKTNSKVTSIIAVKSNVCMKQKAFDKKFKHGKV